MSHAALPIRVLVVDDHTAFRSSAVALLEASGFAVVGEASTGAEATAAARTLRPDVVLLDVRLPDDDGFTIAGRLALLPYPPAVVLISSRDAVTYGARLYEAPVRGFLAKSGLTGAALRAMLG